MATGQRPSQGWNAGLSTSNTGLVALVLMGAMTMVILGCPSGPNAPAPRMPLITSDDPKAEADLRAAKLREEEGDHPGAEMLYQAFLKDHAKDPLVPVAELALGRLLLERNETAAALRYFQRASAHADESIAEQGRFLAGAALEVLGNHEAAITHLRPLVGRTVAPADTALLLRSLAQAQLALGDRVASVSSLDLMLRSNVTEDAKQAARALAVNSILPQVSPEELARITDTLDSRGSLWPLFAKRALRAAYSAGDMDHVRGLAEQLREHNVEFEDELRTMALRAEQSETSDPRVIGAILPLSGRARAVGQDALRGLMLAAGAPEDGPADPNGVRVVFRDDGGDPAKAAAAVDDLATTHRAIAIIGPLSGDTAATAAARAEALGIPLITLTPRGKDEPAARMVSHLLLSPAAETAALVAAAREAGATRFAVLHADAPYGNAMADAFAQAVTDLGGSVTANVTYEGGATSFGPAMASLHEASFDALFVADSASKVALLAPALAASGLWPSETPRLPEKARHITLLVPSAGYDDSLAASTGRYLQGALFSVPFDPRTADGASRTFTNAFLEKYGTEPSLFAASAFDAIGLINAAVAGGAKERESVALKLRTFTTETAGPSKGIDARGEPRQATRLLVLRGMRFEPRSGPFAMPVGKTSPAAKTH